MVELDCEAQLVELCGLYKRSLFARNIFDVEARSCPALGLLLGFPFRIHEGLHAVVVQTIWLYQIHNVEPVDSSLDCVAYSKVKPLS